jgi:archaetidylinositol phosphate synthase
LRCERTCTLMPELQQTALASQIPWDARLARRLVSPLKDSWVTPNYLTTIRLLIGLAASASFLPGTYAWANLGALLAVLSNFADHTDGELARLSGRTSRAGHLYDLTSDACATVALFFAMGVGVSRTDHPSLQFPPGVLGAIAGTAIALIFFLRMRIEERAGKIVTRQSSLQGFETEDVLYLLPLVTLCNGVATFVLAAAIGAPLFAAWVAIDYVRVSRRLRAAATGSAPRVLG